MTTPTPTQALERDLAQFFFEMGFGACYAEAIVRNGNKVPFPLTDAEIERQWAISQEAYDDPAELAAMLSQARHRQSSNAASVGERLKQLAERAIDRFAAQEAYLGKEERAEVAKLRADFAALASLSTPTAEQVCRDNELTPEFRAMTALQKWETLTLHGLLGTNEPWIENMRQHLKADAALRAADPIGGIVSPSWGDDYVDAAFTNEHGNVIGITVRKPFFDQGDPDAQKFNRRSVSIEISGPDSQHENHITLLEARALATCLNAALSPLSDLHPLGQEYDGDALREALANARHYVEEAVDADGGIDACEIHMRHDLEAIDRALSATRPAQEEATCDLCGGEGVNRASQLWPDHPPACRACNGSGLLATPATTVDETERLREAVDFIDKFFEPWGSWKTAWWEGEVSDDAAFSADNALKHVANILRRALSDRPQAEGEVNRG